MNKRTNNGAITTFSVNSKNELTSVGANSYTYDSNGNLTNPSFLVYDYDAENQLKSVTYPNTQKTDFVCDGRGRLRKRIEYTWNSTFGTWQQTDEVRYVYDGMRVIQERNSSNTPTVAYTRGNDMSGSFEGAGGIGGLLARSHGYSAGSWSTHSYYHADGGGNITMLVDGSQATVASYRYDPYGNTISSSGSLAATNVYRFSSKELIVNWGLYYYGYRFYDPNLQRWLNRDPIGEFEGINLYAFVLNSPPSLMDPLGLSEIRLDVTFDSSFSYSEHLKYWNRQLDFLGNALKQCCQEFRVGCDVKIDPRYDWLNFPLAPDKYSSAYGPGKPGDGIIPVRLTTRPIGDNATTAGQGGPDTGIVLQPTEPETLAHELGHVVRYPCKPGDPKHNPKKDYIMSEVIGSKIDECWCKKLARFAK
jgi:RHS repeat-associated protein